VDRSSGGGGCVRARSQDCGTARELWPGLRLSTEITWGVKAAWRRGGEQTSGNDLCL